jgi:spore coat protein U-like protein
MRKTLRPVALGVLLALSGASIADAATSTGSFQVSLTIQGACSLQSTSDLAFGSQSAVASNLDATSSIGVQCSNTTPYTIGLSAGAGTGATVAARLLSVGGATIPYTIYRDSNRTQLWGTTANIDTQSGTGNGALQTFTAYGRVAPVANPAVGAYTDSISVTVTY